MKKSGEELFTNGRSLMGFWRWAYSDILSNSERGHLAEFIVAMSLGVDQDCRKEWDAYDLLFENNIRIEIKSSAYLQSWKQNRLSKVVFDIKPTRLWNEISHKYSDSRMRRSDIYIFCLFKCSDVKNANPLDLSQWDFYIVKTTEINDKLSDQKTLSLNGLKKLDHKKVDFTELRKTVESIQK